MNKLITEGGNKMEIQSTIKAGLYNDLTIEIIELANTDFKAAQNLFNDNVFKFDEVSYNTLMDLLDK